MPTTRTRRVKKPEMVEIIEYYQGGKLVKMTANGVEIPLNHLQFGSDYNMIYNVMYTPPKTKKNVKWKKHG